MTICDSKNAITLLSQLAVTALSSYYQHISTQSVTDDSNIPIFYVEYTITFNLCHENALVYISKATLHTPFEKT